MTRVLHGLIFAAVLSTAVFAQSAATAPAFEIADVHAVTAGPVPHMRGGALTGGLYIVRNASLLELIRSAYGVTDRSMFGEDDNRTIVGGPTWLDSDRFDVTAKTTGSPSPETVNLMLRTLLADRFKLVVHSEPKPMPAFALTRGSGKPKMKEADGSGEAGCRFPQKDPAYFDLTCRNVTLDAFGEALRRVSYALNNPIVDSTGLKGSWDFDLRWRGPEALTIFDAISQQLGLKLESREMPRPVIVIDSVNRKPTANPPGVEAILPPPPPTQFEVAVIKPSMPGENPRRRLQAGGRLELQAFTLRMLINIAWDINNDEMLAGAPKFVDSSRFDVDARVSTGAGGPGVPVDVEDIRPMLQNLLMDRFKLRTHQEDRPVNAFKLVSVKPKLQKSDPASRAGCKGGPGADGKDPRVNAPWLARLVSCQNVTLAQFAEQLPYWAGGYVNAPVADATGLKGDFDLTLNFSPAGLIQSANQAAPAAANAAADPNRLLSLFDALTQQLGLKLETEKRSLPVLVIDHVEESPTEN